MIPQGWEREVAEVIMVNKVECLASGRFTEVQGVRCEVLFFAEARILSK